MATTQQSAMKIVFGAMTFGKAGAEQARVHDHATASAILDTFRSHGHRDVDTASSYGEGTSETMLAELDWRSRGFTVASKYYPTAGRIVPAQWDNTLRHTPEGLRKSLMQSLKALKTEKLALWYLHAPDRTTPFAETFKAVNELYQEGLFTRLGLSNYQAWEVAQICEKCRLNDWKQPDVYQGVYNAFHRTVELELFACLRHYGISFYAYNPLAGGYLTDRYHRDTEAFESGSRFDPGRFQGQAFRKRYWNDAYFDALDGLRSVAGRYRLTEAECALRWLRHHSLLNDTDAIIVGASSVEHLEANLLDLEKGELPDEVVDALNNGWDSCKGVAFNYWHLAISAYL